MARSSCRSSPSSCSRSLAPDVELVDLGEHRLRDLARADAGLPGDAPRPRRVFPPLRSLDASRGNLPVQLSSFVGRDARARRVCGAAPARAARDAHRRRWRRQDPPRAAGRGRRARHGSPGRLARRAGAHRRSRRGGSSRGRRARCRTPAGSARRRHRLRPFRRDPDAPRPRQLRARPRRRRRPRRGAARPLPGVSCWRRAANRSISTASRSYPCVRSIRPPMRSAVRRRARRRRSRSSMPTTTPSGAVREDLRWTRWSTSRDRARGGTSRRCPRRHRRRPRRPLPLSCLGAPALGRPPPDSAGDTRVVPPLAARARTGALASPRCLRGRLRGRRRAYGLRCRRRLASLVRQSLVQFERDPRRGATACSRPCGCSRSSSSRRPVRRRRSGGPHAEWVAGLVDHPIEDWQRGGRDQSRHPRSRAGQLA